MREMFPHPSWIEVDLAQFKKNISIVRAHVGHSLLCLPIKANAYGHGLVPIAKAAAASGIDYLAVAHLQEGVTLRQEGILLPILVLGAIHEDQIVDLLQFNLEFSISSLYKARLVKEACEKISQKCRVHIEVDTGMQRTGVRVESALKLFSFLQEFPQFFEIKGIYSHLATGDRPLDPFALCQIQAFQTLLQNPLFGNTPLIRHLANSGGVLYYPSSYLDMVRPSLLTFGYAPKEASPSLRGVNPCFSVRTKVSYFKVVEANQGISYGHAYITPKKTRIITVPIGYGDGYRRCLSNKAEVLIRGKRFPLVGAVCMDQCMVDVGDREVFVGEEVVLIGRQGDEEIKLEEIAKLYETIPYEVLCSFNDRLPRVYRE